MAEYGVTPEGYARKPLAVRKAELERSFRQVFGADIILSPQSPAGQLIGLFADAVTEVDEVSEAVYQAHDPDQAEGAALDTLARLRNLYRNGRPDEALRAAITNEGRGSVDVQDINAAVARITGVTYSRVFVNYGDQEDDNGLPAGRIAVAVIGGDDEEIADAMRLYIAPGVSIFGNTYINSLTGGYCQSYPVVRPVDVPVSIVVTVNARRDRADCPAPSLAAIQQAIAEGWAVSRQNGRDVSFYTIRSIVEALYPSVEVVTVEGERPDVEPLGVNQPARIAFTEIASLALANIDVRDA
ncbi:hypothetical protein [Tropicimonas sp. IMCC34011]|uniref:hypothetical protein n=1 Tax=Tropicimonas sp. IMCC34011 TaxID=2248759 RepID=UPI000E26F13F|nr:hypothetical protein [Tropicimonas sp. IMCC34011]